MKETDLIYEGIATPQILCRGQLVKREKKLT